MTAEDIEDYLYGLADETGCDWGLRIDVAFQCCWGAELRITPEPNKTGTSDVSTVFFRGGAASPLDAMQRVFQDFLDSAVRESLKKKKGKKKRQ